MGGMMGPKDNTDFDLLTLYVTIPTANPITTIPTLLTTNSIWPQSGAANRSIGLSAQPMMSMTNFFMNGLKFDMEKINFTTELGTTEIWTITNQTMMAHPFHIHGNHFYVLTVNGVAPALNLRCRKDVVVVPPMGGSVKLITRYEDFSDPEMPFMYHCHILSHEDNGMMGQFIVHSTSSGTKENAAQKHLHVVPTLLNNDTDNVAITADPGWEPTRLELFDATGRLVLNQSNSSYLSTHTLAQGSYFLRVSTAFGIGVFKISKSN